MTSLSRKHRENYLKISDKVQETAAETLALLEAVYVLLSEALLIEDISTLKQSIESTMHVMENSTEEWK